MIQRLKQRFEAFAIHIVMACFSDNVRKVAATKYMSDKKLWHLAKANKHWLNEDMRRKHLESSIIYENAILNISLEDAEIALCKVKSNAQ